MDINKDDINIYDIDLNQEEFKNNAKDENSKEYKEIKDLENIEF